MKESILKSKITLYVTRDCAAVPSKACRVSGLSKGTLVEQMLLRTLERAKRNSLPSSLRYGPVQAVRAAEQLFRDDRASYATVAEALNKDGYQTTQGRPWNRYSVFRLLNRSVDPIPKVAARKTKARTKSATRKRGR